MKKVASLRYGVIFKKAFCDPEIFTAFARDIGGVEIEIDQVETEKEFNPPVGYVKSRYDLFAQDKKNRVIVDIQHERYEEHYDRFMHYHMAAIMEQVANSWNYRVPMRVLTIVVLTSGDKHKKDIVITDFDPKDLKGNPIGEMRHKIIYLCPKYVNDETPEPLRSWMLAIQDTLDEEVNDLAYSSSTIRKIFEHIEKDSVTPEERAKAFDEYCRESLMKEERREGIQEGRIEGIKEGIAEGIEKGKFLEKQQMAKNMLAAGFDIQTVVKISGLSEDVILQ